MINACSISPILLSKQLFAREGLSKDDDFSSTTPAPSEQRIDCRQHARRRADRTGVLRFQDDL